MIALRLIWAMYKANFSNDIKLTMPKNKLLKANNSFMIITVLEVTRSDTFTNGYMDWNKDDNLNFPVFFWYEMLPL